MDLTKINIEKLFSRLFADVPIKIIESSHGIDQEVKIVITKNRNYVLKKPRREKYVIGNEVFAAMKWGEIGIPVPKTIWHDKELLIQEFIDGEKFGKVKLSKNNKMKIYYQVGKIMKKMHSVETKGYANIKGKGVGEFSSSEEYKNWALRRVKTSFSIIKKRKLMSDADLVFLKKEVERLIKYFGKNKFVLTHQDLVEDHIFVKDNKLVGIIDFGDIKSDDPMADFRKIARNNEDYFKEVIRGYGQVNKDNIELHQLLVYLYRVYNYYRRKDNKNLKGLVEQIKKEYIEPYF